MRTKITSTLLQNRHLFNSIDAYTMNMHVKGSDIENICTNGNTRQEGVWNAPISYDFDTSKLDSGGNEWTICFNIEKTGLDQGEFDQAFVSIEVPGFGGTSITGPQILVEGMGKITKKVTLNKQQMGGHNISEYKIVFYAPFNKQLVVNDIVLVKGHYSHYIPYFKGTKALGPKVMIRNQNKNILRPEYLNSTMFYNGTQVVDDKSDTYVTYVIPTMPGTGYSISKVNLPELKGNERMQITYYKDKPKNGDRPFYTEGGTTNTDLKHGFTTPVGTTYTMIYLGYAGNKPKYPISRLVKDVQLELGTTPSTYIPHAESTKIVDAGRELSHNDQLIFKDDYNRIVLDTPSGVEEITKYYDMNVQTYDGPNLLEVHDISEHDEFLLGSIAFDYYEPIRKDAQHPNQTYILRSGDQIDISRYGKVDGSHDKDGYIILKDGYNGEPDKTIIIKEIVKILEN